MRRVVFLACLLRLVAYGQSVERNELTFTGGYGWQATVELGEQRLSAVSLGGNYSFRVRRWLALEAGLLTAIDPSGAQNSEYGVFNIHDRYTWLPIGVRFIVPLRHDRFEISGGVGGVYERYSGGSTPISAESYSGGGGYFKAKAAFALDSRRHFWLGTTPHFFLVNGTYSKRDRWFVLTGDISFRF